MIGKQPSEMKPGHHHTAIVSLAICLLGTPAWAQSATDLATDLTFEVASIKANIGISTAINGAPFVIKGRYTVINYPLRFLIAEAFGFEARDQVIGGPDWTKSAKYDITAKAELLTPTRAQQRTMLQALLKNR